MDTLTHALSGALLARAGISAELLAMPQARVSSSAYGLLWHGIAQAIDDEFFGLDSRRMKSGSFTLLCHALIHSDTLERALTKFHLWRHGSDLRAWLFGSGLPRST